MLLALRNDMTAIGTYVASLETICCPVEIRVGESSLQVVPGGHFYLTEPGSTATGEIAKRLLSFVTDRSRR